MKIDQIIAYGRVHRFTPGPDALPMTAPEGYYLMDLGPAAVPPPGHRTSRDPGSTVMDR